MIAIEFPKNHKKFQKNRKIYQKAIFFLIKL